MSPKAPVSPPLSPNTWPRSPIRVALTEDVERLLAPEHGAVLGDLALLDVDGRRLHLAGIEAPTLDALTDDVRIVLGQSRATGGRGRLSAGSDLVGALVDPVDARSRRATLDVLRTAARGDVLHVIHDPVLSRGVSVDLGVLLSDAIRALVHSGVHVVLHLDPAVADRVGPLGLRDAGRLLGDITTLDMDVAVDVTTLHAPGREISASLCRGVGVIRDGRRTEVELALRCGDALVAHVVGERVAGVDGLHLALVGATTMLLGEDVELALGILPLSVDHALAAQRQIVGEADDVGTVRRDSGLAVDAVGLRVLDALVQLTELHLGGRLVATREVVAVRLLRAGDDRLPGGVEPVRHGALVLHQGLRSEDRRRSRETAGDHAQSAVESRALQQGLLVHARDLVHRALAELAEVHGGAAGEVRRRGARVLAQGLAG